jgi:hypothetical protein
VFIHSSRIFSSGRQYYWASALVTLVTVVLFCLGYEYHWKHLYAQFPYYRLQVEALLQGRLSLGSSIEQIDHGLAWYNGQLNQVWGLGIALWTVPFELIGRSFGSSPCPERIPLLVAVALVAWYVTRGGVAIARAFRSRTMGLSFVYIILLYPPLWTLIMGPRVIFEQTIFYACLVSTALFVATVRFLLLGRRTDFFIVCLLAGLSGLVRVTHGVYGVSAAVICGGAMIGSALSFQKNGKRACDWARIWELLSGWCIVLGGLLFLAYSNDVRYGSITECGHRMTNHLADTVYLTRFGNPFAKSGFFDASKELFSWLFLSPFHRSGWDVPQVVPWQAMAYRWRGASQLTFDPSFLAVIVLSCLAWAVFFRRKLRGGSGSFRQLFNPKKPVQRVLLGMMIWLFLNTFALAAFYLYSPILATRYILDFAPAFLASFVLALILAHRYKRIFFAALLIWICSESIARLAAHGSAIAQLELSATELIPLPRADGRKLASFNGRYAMENHPEDTHIKYNGQGWGLDGAAAPIVTLMLDRPQFLELVVGPRPPESGLKDRYRAKIGTIELPLESLTRDAAENPSAIKVRFGIPKKIREQDKDQVAFLCFTEKWEPADRQSQRQLFAVRWK